MRKLRLSELIERLQEFKEQCDAVDLDPIVMASSDYGDHVHTEQLLHIRSIISCVPTETAYSESGLRVPPHWGESEGDADDGIDDDTVIVLRYIP